MREKEKMVRMLSKLVERMIEESVRQVEQLRKEERILEMRELKREIERMKRLEKIEEMRKQTNNFKQPRLRLLREPMKIGGNEEIGGENYYNRELRGNKVWEEREWKEVREEITRIVSKTEEEW